MVAEGDPLGLVLKACRVSAEGRGVLQSGSPLSFRGAGGAPVRWEIPAAVVVGPPTFPPVTLKKFVFAKGDDLLN